VRRSDTYRDYSPGPPLRSVLDHEGRTADELRLLIFSKRYGDVARALDKVSTMNRDDVTVDLVMYLTDAHLVTMATDPAGRLLTARLYDELTSGNTSQQEEVQAHRLLKARASGPDAIKRFGQAASDPGLRVFPFRKGGFFAAPAIPFAHFTREGKIHVEMPMNVRTNDTFRRDWRTLPLATFAGGIDLDPDEIIGVRMYDEGGDAIEKVPALRLIALSNAGVTHTMTKIAEVAGYGLGGIGGGVAKVGLTAKALLWADRAAVVFGVLSSAISENRGWFIHEFGEEGREFVDAVETVNSAIALFGVARVAVELPRLVISFGSKIAAVRRAGNAATLAGEEAAGFRRTIASAEELQSKLELIAHDRPAANDNIDRALRHEQPAPGMAANDNIEHPSHPEPPSHSMAANENVEIEDVRMAAGAEGHEPTPGPRREKSPLDVEASAGGRAKSSQTGKAPPGSRTGAASTSHERVSSKPGTSGKRGTWTEPMHKAAVRFWRKFAPEKCWIDMSKAPEGLPRTADGWQRSSDWFWRQFYDKFGNETWMSTANRAAAKEGYACLVDAEWLKKFPEQEAFIGDLLHHHHVEQGPFAAPVPRRAHQIFDEVIHDRL
jgi:hypothetical protein